MATPNFDPKQYIDPASLAPAMQNKAAIEEQMRNNKFNRLIEAVKTGQNIANDMMDFAEKRRQMKGREDVSSILAEKPMQPPTASTSTMGNVSVQPSPEQQAALNNDSSDRKRRLLEALSRSNPDQFGKEVLQQQFSSTSSPKEQVHYLTLDDGSTVVSRFSTNGGGFMDMQGKPLAEDVMKRVVNRTYAGEFGIDTFGNQFFGNKSTGQTTPVKKEGTQDLGDLSDPDNALINLRTQSPKVYEKVSGILESVSPAKNPRLETLISAAASSTAAKAILMDPNPSQVGLASLGFHMARSSGSNSQLSDSERETFQEPLEFLEKLKNKGWKLAAGDLSPMMKADLLRLNNLLERKSIAQARKMLATERRRARVEAGSFWNDGLDKAFPTVEGLIAEAKEIIPDDSFVDTSPSANSQVLDAIAKTLGLPKKKK